MEGKVKVSTPSATDGSAAWVITSPVAFKISKFAFVKPLASVAVVGKVTAKAPISAAVAVNFTFAPEATEAKRGRCPSCKAKVPLPATAIEPASPTVSAVTETVAASPAFVEVLISAAPETVALGKVSVAAVHGPTEPPANSKEELASGVPPTLV